ncbi:MAG: hypothetical protein Q4C41_03365 [Eggerthellaceae bacterium]|nr:hypothetical protein [Eggerthellaceae bacterium]
MEKAMSGAQALKLALATVLAALALTLAAALPQTAWADSTGGDVASRGEKVYSSVTAAINDADNTDTLIELIGEANEQVVVPENASLTIDLKGHKITHTHSAGEQYSPTIYNKGTLTIKDTVGNGGVVSTNETAVGVGSGSSTTIESGSFESVEGAVITGNSTGATINIKDGTFSASDNAVVAGNGSVRDGNANTINISGGTFNGQIKSGGYIACGIYAPWRDTFNITGGTFNIEGGAGIVARAGTVNVSDGAVFNVTSAASDGWVGDNKNLLPSSAVVFDANAGYPGMTNDSQVAITGGTFNSGAAAIAVLAPDGTVASRAVATAGTFSSDVSDFVPEGSTSASVTPEEGAATYFVGTPDDVAAAVTKSATAGSKVTVQKGDLELDGLTGVSVENKGDGKVTVCDVDAEKGAPAVTMYAVTFAANDKPAAATQYVSAGNKASAPDSPEPAADQCRFEGWVGSDGKTWDFASNTVESDVALTAKFSEHKPVDSGFVAPTCAKAGHEADQVCQVCGKVVAEGAAIPATGKHSVDGKKFGSDAESHWNVCTVCGEGVGEPADHEFEWVVDKEATATEPGSKHQECTVCGYAKGSEAIPATGAADTNNTTTDKPAKPAALAKTGDAVPATALAAAGVAAAAAIACGFAAFRKGRKSE